MFLVEAISSLHRGGDLTDVLGGGHLLEELLLGGHAGDADGLGLDLDGLDLELMWAVWYCWCGTALWLPVYSHLYAFAYTYPAPVGRRPSAVGESKGRGRAAAAAPAK
jgi:hypothetical protein